MVNHTTIETLVGYILEPNQGYGESHNNRDIGWLHFRTKLGLW